MNFQEISEKSTLEHEHYLKKITGFINFEKKIIGNREWGVGSRE
jgi:hypothetical protein